jgi:hypothetical protein
MQLHRIAVDFSRPIRPWDGFGVNYVEACQTRDYAAEPQDYGGFSRLDERARAEILDLTFGDDGLRPGIVKMFLDPWHQRLPGPAYDLAPDAHDPHAYDHDATTRHMLAFVQGGVERLAKRGDALRAIVTLYGPPAWMTLQRFVRGRDLDPALKTEVAKYLIAWAKHLRDAKGVPVAYLSLHNEGEDWIRWPLDGSSDGDAGHDYNLYWPPEQVVDFLRFMPAMLAAHGLAEVGVTPGECTGWYRFQAWGYADAIADDPEALRGLGLVTSHGFKGGDIDGDWFNDWRSAGIDALRDRRPDLHAWVTSTSWSKMDVFFLEEMRQNVYAAKVNAIIPWATIQLQGHWEGGDPNPGTAFRVYDDGRYEVTKGYHFFKQVCRAGQPGTSVCRAHANDRRIGLIAFGGRGSRHPDAFVVLNLADEEREFEVEVRGSEHAAFAAFRTSEGDDYVPLGEAAVRDGRIAVRAPPRSATTYFGR